MLNTFTEKQLRRPYRIRCKAIGQQESLNATNALTSGFAFRTLGALDHGDDLCVLQLHGSIAWPRSRPGESIICHGDLFGTTVRARVQRLCFSAAVSSQPPILFPWEVLDEKGVFVSEQSFCLKESIDPHRRRQGGYTGPTTLHQLFMSIWKRAQKEIGRASKISFVGLSMHDFLTPAFKFLFAERKEDASIICASREHEQFRSADGAETMTNPRSPTFKLTRLLKEICPTITGVPKVGPPEAWPEPYAKVRVRETFQEFIQNEMD